MDVECDLLKISELDSELLVLKCWKHYQFSSADEESSSQCWWLWDKSKPLTFTWFTRRCEEVGVSIAIPDSKSYERILI